MSIKNLLKIFVISGLVLNNGCRAAPKVSPCLYRAESGGCFYAPIDSDDVQFRSNSEMDKNVCFTPEEHQIIMEWIKRQGSQKAVSKAREFQNELNLITEYSNGNNPR